MRKNTTDAATLLNDYERALERARRNHVQIVGRGRVKSDGAPVVAVSSGSRKNFWHLVVVGRNRLYCTCLYGRRGNLCTHRAVVHQELLRLWDIEQDKREREEEAALKRALRELNEWLQQPAEAVFGNVLPVAVPRGDTPTISQRQADALLSAPRRETVRGVYDTKPVTIWK